jgi:hypothetical protein
VDVCKDSYFYKVFRAQDDWTFILPSELAVKVLRHLPGKMQPRSTAYEKSDKHAAAFFSEVGQLFRRKFRR